jgi:hypothetical protein
MTDEPIPPFEWSPPYSLEFVAHLEAGCYPDDVTPRLMAAVRSDPAGARMLDALTIVQMELRLLGDR